MNVINLTSREFKNLAPLEISPNIIHIEGELYHYQEKSAWNKEKKLLKIFYDNTGDQFSNKLYTINSLIEHRSDIAINAETKSGIVLPEKLVIVDDKVCGFSLPYIPNHNLSDILNDPGVENEDKINYLRQIEAILKGMKKVRKYSSLTDFYIGDLHEANFILDENNRVRVVDMDSCKIANNNYNFGAKYLNRLTVNGAMIAKYATNDIGYVIPSENTDLYCYNIMILNTLFRRPIRNLSCEQFYTYLTYLDSIQYPKSLLNGFNKLYQPVDNDYVGAYLEELSPVQINKAHHIVFEKKLGQK